MILFLALILILFSADPILRYLSLATFVAQTLGYYVGANTRQACIKNLLLVAAIFAVFVNYLLSSGVALIENPAARILALCSIAALLSYLLKLARGNLLESNQVKEAGIPFAKTHFIVFATTVLFLNYKALYAPFLYMGDTLFHVEQIYAFRNTLNILSIENAFYVFIGSLFAYLYFRSRTWILIAVLLALLLTVTCDLSIFSQFNRYPLLYYSLSSLISYPLFNYQEIEFKQAALTRILPLLSFSTVAYLSSRFLTTSKIQLFFLALAMTSIPVVRYYLTLTYIDLVPLSLLSLFVIYLARSNFQISFLRMLSSLLVISAFKETLWPITLMLALFWLCKTSQTKLNDLIRIFIFLVLPTGLFLLFRSDVREYKFNFLSLLSFANYRVLLASLLRDYAIILAFMPAAFYFAKKRSYFDLCLLITLLVVPVIFFMADGAINQNGLTRYIGLSRFDLYLLPAVLLSIYYIFIAATERTKLLLTAIILTSNLYNNPISFLSGSRKAWEVYELERPDLNYAYDDFYRWLAEQKEIKQVLIFGRAYRYPDRYYLRQNQITNIDVVDLASSKSHNINLDGDSLVLLQIKPDQTLEQARISFASYTRIQIECKEQFKRGDLVLSLCRRSILN